MSNRARAKGTVAENGVRDFLRANGYTMAERLPSNGIHDRGDIAGVSPELVIEIKNVIATNLAGWTKEARVERENAKAQVGVVWHKKKGTTNAGEWYVTMTGEDFIRLLHRYAPPTQVASTVTRDAVPLSENDSHREQSWENQTEQRRSTPRKPSSEFVETQTRTTSPRRLRTPSTPTRRSPSELSEPLPSTRPSRPRQLPARTLPRRGST